MPAAWASRLAGRRSRSRTVPRSAARLVDQLDRGVADRDRVRLAVDVEEAHGLAEQAACIVDLLDGDLGALGPGSSNGAWSPVMQIAPPIRISALAGAASATSPASDSPTVEFSRCLIVFPSWSWVAPRRRRAGLVVDPSGQDTCQNARRCKTSRMHRLFFRRPAWTPFTNRIAPSGCKGAQRAILLPFQATALTPAGRCSSSITWAVVRVRQ